MVLAYSVSPIENFDPQLSDMVAIVPGDHFKPSLMFNVTITFKVSQTNYLLWLFQVVD
jgi:hypothetical protein